MLTILELTRVRSDIAQQLVQDMLGRTHNHLLHAHLLYVLDIVLVGHGYTRHTE